MVVAIVAAKCFGFDKAGKAYWKQNWGRGAGSLNLIEEWAKDAWINQRRKRTGVCISFVVDIFRVQTFNLGEWAKHISKQVQTRGVLGLRMKMVLSRPSKTWSLAVIQWTLNNIGYSCNVFEILPQVRTFGPILCEQFLCVILILCKYWLCVILIMCNTDYV